MGEHIRREAEDWFVSNLNHMCKKHLVLSWFPRPGEGSGHINERPNEYVIERMGALGFMLDADLTCHLRSVACLWWFRESLMWFERTGSINNK